LQGRPVWKEIQFETPPGRPRGFRRWSARVLLREAFYNPKRPGVWIIDQELDTGDGCELYCVQVALCDEKTGDTAYVHFGLDLTAHAAVQVANGLAVPSGVHTSANALVYFSKPL
jgi:hypothetical protein